MLAFRGGEARAFETLVLRHRGAIFNFILRQTGQRARAEDVLQETWLKVVRSAGQWQPRAKVTTWLYTVARNLCVDSARKESYRRTETLGEAAPGEEHRRPVEPQADPVANPDRSAHNREVRPLLEKALRSLSAEQREVFVLREYSGIAFKEIAEVTGVSENTVKSRMRYALEALRKKLAELGVDGSPFGSDGERTAAG